MTQTVQPKTGDEQRMLGKNMRPAEFVIILIIKNQKVSLREFQIACTEAGSKKQHAEENILKPMKTGKRYRMKNK